MEDISYLLILEVKILLKKIKQISGGKKWNILKKNYQLL